MKKFKICLLLLGATNAQTGCSSTDVCPEMGDDFSCGKLLNTYPDPEVFVKRPSFEFLLLRSEHRPELYKMWLYDNIDVQIRWRIEQV